MAYLQFFEPGIAAPASYMPQPVIEADSGATPLQQFSPLEWSVVAVAWGDRLSSLRRPGRFATALGTIFGGTASHFLADPRLEALRRMAVLTWHHGFAVAPQEVRVFLQAGFSAEQYELLVDRIAATQAENRTRSHH